MTTTDVVTAFGAFLRLYVADGDASPETIRSYYGKAAQFVEATRLRDSSPSCPPPDWRRDRDGQPRYLYLIHPTQDDGSRQREYIGADLDKQAEALARVKAWDELQAVRSEIREVDHRLAAITGHLARALLAATNGLSSHW